jgi:ubiquinone/menaquinone biosynthesis C-methylase UbiE
MIRTFFNQRAVIWDETVAEKDRNKLRAMAGRLNIAAGAVVLDVGTGTGVFLPYLLDKLGHSGHIVAIDVAEEMLRHATAKGFDGYVDFLNADVQHVPLPDAVFDCVVCYSSFPHFQNKPRALREMRRVVKDGGRLFICHTSSRDHINGIHCEIPEVASDLIPEEAVMRQMLTDAGFSEIQIEDGCRDYLCCACKQGGSHQPEGRRLEVEAHIEGLGGMGESADGDEVDSGLRCLAQVGQRDSA